MRLPWPRSLASLGRSFWSQRCQNEVDGSMLARWRRRVYRSTGLFTSTTPEPSTSTLPASTAEGPISSAYSSRVLPCASARAALGRPSNAMTSICCMPRSTRFQLMEMSHAGEVSRRVDLAARGGGMPSLRVTPSICSIRRDCVAISRSSRRRSVSKRRTRRSSARIGSDIDIDITTTAVMSSAVRSLRCIGERRGETAG